MDDLRKIMKHLRSKCISENVQIFYLNMAVRYKYDEFHIKIKDLSKITGCSQRSMPRFLKILSYKGFLTKKKTMENKICVGTSIRLLKWWLRTEDKL